MTEDIPAGASCVSIFLFFSGYGLMHSSIIKGNNYLDGFLQKRILKVIIPLFTAYIACLILKVIQKEPIPWLDIFTSFFTYTPYLQFSWFVSEIVLLYFLFYLCFRWLPSRIRLKFLTVLLACIILLSNILHVPNWWILSLPGFVIGFWYRVYENKVMNYEPRYVLLVTSICVVLFFLMSRFDLTSEVIPFLARWRYVFINMNLLQVLVPFLLVMVLAFIPEIKYSNIYIRSYYEIYLLQSIIMAIVGYWADSSVLFISFVLIFLPVVASFFYRVNNFISSYLC